MKTLCALACLFLATAPYSRAQLIINANKTAAQLASALTGTGVTVIGPTLTCAGNANGAFTSGAVVPLGFSSGIILTTGDVKDTLGGFGVGDPSSTFASTGNGTAGDAQLTTLAGEPTYDACVLQFDFKPAGDTIRFDYVFGSEEYTDYTCSPYNDVFAFFISGGTYPTPTNIALVPGTSIPVAVNSVNCGATGGYPLSTCTAMGAGSPFCAYYVNNLVPSSPAYNYVTYDGLTTVLQAVAAVSPCDTYHLKLAVADATDDIFDSGVFLKGGSLTSNTSSAVTSTGTSGLPYCIRGCAPGNFIFSIPEPQDTNVVIHYTISGSAVNGYDYATIGTTDTIVASQTSDTLDINTLIVPPAGPKVVTITIQIPDPCHPGVYTAGASSSLTILDSFNFHIQTPDTSICLGQYVHAIAIGDSVFDSILHYTWTPPGTVGNDTALITNITPTVTTTYTLTATTAAVLGCSPEQHTITIGVYNPTLGSVAATNPTVCGYCDGTITLFGLQTGFMDTVVYTYNGVPQSPLPVTVSGSGTAIITGLCPGTYSNIYVKAGFCVTPSKGPLTIVNPAPPTVSVDSPVVKTCVGIPVQLHAYPSDPGIATYSYVWAPPANLNSSTIFNPIVTPTAPGDVTYTVTINPGTDPACASSDTVHVHTVPNDFTVHPADTAICIGQSVLVNITGGSSEFGWLWTPPGGVSNTTTMDPTLTPATTTVYTVTASYAHCPDMVHTVNIEVDYPAPVQTFADTICLGTPDSVNLAVAGSGYYHYQWTPSTYVSNDTLPNPYLTPTVTGTFSWTVTIQPHAAACAITDIVNLLVTPNTIQISPHDTAICRGQSVQVTGTPYPLYSYQWVPTAGIPVSNIIDPVITPDTSALYVVTASYRKCPDMHDTLNLDVQPNPSVYIGGNRTVCQNDTIHIYAGVTPQWYTHYIYSWTPAAWFENSTEQTVVLTGIAPGTITIIDTVRTPAGCSAMDSAHITVYPANLDSIKADLDFCPHDTAILQPLGASLSYQWYPALYLSSDSVKNPVIRPVTSQAYTVVATDEHGCTDTLNFNVIVHPGAVIYIPDSVTIYPGESYQISPQTNCVNFMWSPSYGLNNVYISDPLAAPEVSTKYIVYASTQYGCSTTDSIAIISDPETLLTVPNAFSPGSGPNNEFKIIKLGIATLKYFRIFNRWGNMVFETTNIDDGWNGEYKGVPQPFGVYVYQIEAVTSTGKIFVKTGNTTLLR